MTHEGTDKLDFIKIKNCCFVKDTVEKSRMKKKDKPQTEKKIFVKDILCHQGNAN